MSVAKALFIVCMLGIFTYFGCKTIQQPNEEYDALLLNCWKNAYEEETEGDLKIYRPCDYTTFGPSRFRNTFTLHENGTSNYLVLSPYDAHYMSEGKWSYDTETKTLSLKNDNDELVDQYEVIELSANKMVLR